MDPSRSLLPIEIIENVVDEASDNTQTLCSLSLTCRDLRLRSHYHLFYSIYLRDMTLLHSLCNVLDLCPHVAPLVFSLTLSATRGDSKSPLSLFQAAPRLLLPKLPNLRTWKMTDLEANNREPRQWLSFPSPTLACLRARGTAIVELHLDSVSLQNCAHFMEYITAFQCLKYLSCRSLYFKTHLDDLQFHSVKQHLAGQLRLSTLSIGRDVPDDATLALLESSLSTLLHLELHVPGETELDVPSLVSELRGLRSMTLALQLCEQGRTMPVCEEAILRTFKIIEALSLHPGSHLQNLIIHLCEVNVSSLLRILSNEDSYPGLKCFSELESILLRLPSLRNIGVHHDMQRDIDWTLTLEQCLPTLSRQKRVTIKRLMSTHRHGRQASHDDCVWSLAVSPNIERIASGSRDHTIILWDTHRRSIVHEWIAHSAGVSELAFSPDSQHLASAGHDRMMVVWDISGSGAKRVATLEGHSDWVYTCTWSPDGTLLVSGSDDGTVRIWDTRTYQQLHSLQSLSGKPVRFVRFSPHGRWIASGGDSTSDCAVWDTATGDLHVVLHGHSGDLRNAAFDLATGRIATASEDHTVRIWDVEKGDALLVLEGHTDWVRDVAFSPDGRRVVSGSDDSTVKVWDSFSSGLLLSLKAHTDNVYVVCFSSDGKYIASASQDKTVRLWRASDGRCIRAFTEHTDKIHHLVYSRDGETLTSGGWDGKVCIRPLCGGIPDEDGPGERISRVILR